MVTYPKQLVLIRHGQSTLNVARAKSPYFFTSSEDKAPFIGVPDHHVGLSPLGEHEARSTGKGLRLTGFSFDHLYDSGYKRTVETLNLILEEFPETRLVPRKHSVLIRERETGYTYCMTKPEVERAFPWFEEYWKTVGPVFARPLGGESIADVIKRVDHFLRQMFSETCGKNVLIVLHGRVLAAMRYLLEGWTYAELEKFLQNKGPINCGVTTYEQSDNTGKLELKNYNFSYLSQER